MRKLVISLCTKLITLLVAWTYSYNRQLAKGFFLVAALFYWSQFENDNVHWSPPSRWRNAFQTTESDGYWGIWNCSMGNHFRYLWKIILSFLVSFRACVVISLPQALKGIFGEKGQPSMGALKGLCSVSTIYFFVSFQSCPWNNRWVSRFCQPWKTSLFNLVLWFAREVAPYWFTEAKE